ncbi:MAG TPA: DNA repair protein RecO [Terriglobia bacterium]|nr:DNA repair protein RecO [Terriglobia bacterium]
MPAEFGFTLWRSVMVLCSSEAVVLRTYDLGNADKIVVAFTRGYGKLRGVAQGARRLKSPFSGRLERFHWVEMTFLEKEGQELVKIDRVELLHAFASNLTEYRSFLQLSLIVELLFETTPDREANDPLFRLVVLVLEEMQDPARSDLAQLYFLVWYLKISGLFPSPKSCAHCELSLLDASRVFYAPDLQGFYCSSCSGSHCQAISPGSFNLLNQIVNKKLKLIERELAGDAQYTELQQIMDRMLRRSFEREFETLTLLREGPRAS